AGAKPELGRAAAEEAADLIYSHLEGAHMVFITAGMGGGTGTGAAPVIARMARERGILTVGVVTKPFTFEGNRRTREAERGIAELTQYVDTLIVIPNQNLFRLANERTGWKEAFKMADNVLYMGVRGVTDLMIAPGIVNLDFADIRTVMLEMGKAMMGTGEAEGEGRAIRAAEAAINNPLLEDTSMAGARGLLINITGGEDMTLFEVDQAANRIREEVDDEANIIFGSAIDPNLEGKIRVSVVATGIDTPAPRSEARPVLQVVNGGPMMAEPTDVAEISRIQPVAGQQGVGQSGAGQPSGLRPPPQHTQETRTGGRITLPPPVPNTGHRPVGLRQQATQTDAQSAEPSVAQQLRDPEPISDDVPPPKRKIPEHLQQPVRTEPARQPPRQNPLFNLPEQSTRQQPVAPPAKRSLFSKMTGAIRGGLPHAAPAPLAEMAHPEVRMDYQGESTRMAGGDEKIEIPVFLRKQSS
ncbi:MAG: cell division protein FtsZ, partial [Alphaproteobacteria bacterium]|nr:cell division protein FtsZ [Alphaproteobacteria bacterium]